MTNATFMVSSWPLVQKESYKTAQRLCCGLNHRHRHCLL
eukprot:CCRYP_008680-RA/>CCRYP_008680-RA protein AED:0.07 eAED:0.07 QI:395/0.5/0.33/1/1/1/3/253/38